MTHPEIRMPPRITNKLVIIVLCIIWIPLTALYFTSPKSEQTITFDKQGNEFHTKARLISKTIELQIQQQVNSLLNVIQNHELYSATGTALQTKLENINTQLPNLVDIKMLPKGSELLQNIPATEPGLHFQFENAIENNMGEIYIFGPVVMNNKHVIVMLSAMHANDKAGIPARLLMVISNMNAINSTVYRFNKEDTSEDTIHLINNRGEVISSSNSALKSQSQIPYEKAFLQTLKQVSRAGKSGYLITKDDSGRKILAGYTGFSQQLTKKIAYQSELEWTILYASPLKSAILSETGLKNNLALIVVVQT